MRKLFSFTAAVAWALSLTSLSAFAQPYPDKPIRLIVPFAVGGANDQVARLLATRLQVNMKQPVVVDNRPGAGGSIGVGTAAKAPPDGYTLVLGETGSVAINPSLVKKPSYDPVRDLVPVALLVELPLVVVTHPGSNIRTLKDLVAFGAGKNISYGSAGAGTVQHLSMELLKKTMNLEMTHIPYKGGAPAMTDLIGGQIPVLCVSASTAQQPAAAGLVVPIAGLGKTRSATFPSLPTAAEQGYPSLNVMPWQGIFAPAGTPPAIVEQLASEINKAMTAPEIRRSVTDLGVDIVDLPREAFARLVRADVDRWAQVIRDGKLSID